MNYLQLDTECVLPCNFDNIYRDVLELLESHSQSVDNPKLDEPMV